jgi:hypothetical protein
MCRTPYVTKSNDKKLPRFYVLDARYCGNIGILHSEYSTSLDAAGR